ncbi:hypothetical protein MLD38_023322 [Melastoma candidum]|uniref:Uncharacterized protein n=1 Tax=Melastoma candidum TaxID=119954 RepID=A0ACB9QM34_9MYRT|nr:hypothetical protein MLD38_023322 [Melastoma candidum]
MAKKGAERVGKVLEVVKAEEKEKFSEADHDGRRSYTLCFGDSVNQITTVRFSFVRGLVLSAVRSCWGQKIPPAPDVTVSISTTSTLAVSVFSSCS